MLGIALGASVMWAVGARNEVQRLTAQVDAMSRSASLALLDHQSASERLRGVEWTARSAPDDRVVAALVDAVKHDSSVNVRLAAIESLRPLLDRPEVAPELLATLGGEAPAIVRVSLAETLLTGNVEGSRPAVEKMLDETELEPAVRDRLQDIMRSSS